MTKRTILIITIIAASCTCAQASEHIGVGWHAGYTRDMGNLSEMTGVTFRPQNNYIAGIMFKLDFQFFFLRFGVDRSVLADRGEIKDSSMGSLESLNIQFTSVPVFTGLNFPVRDRGAFFMGIGGEYIITGGDIRTTAGRTRIDTDIFGFGFISGIQIRASDSVRALLEWEYLYAKTGPVADIDSPSLGQKSFAADYTGHRIFIGILYYMI